MVVPPGQQMQFQYNAQVGGPPLRPGQGHAVGHPVALQQAQAQAIPGGKPMAAAQPTNRPQGRHQVATGGQVQGTVVQSPPSQPQPNHQPSQPAAGQGAAAVSSAADESSVPAGKPQSSESSRRRVKLVDPSTGKDITEEVRTGCCISL